MVADAGVSVVANLRSWRGSIDKGLELAWFYAELLLFVQLPHGFCLPSSPFYYLHSLLFGRVARPHLGPDSVNILQANVPYTVQICS